MDRYPRLNVDTVRDAARQAGDATDGAIASRTGVRASTISRLFAGAATPSLSTLIAVRRAYGIPLDALIEELEEVANAQATKPLPVAA